MLSSHLSARFAKIEQVLKPKGRYFCFIHHEGDEPGFDERLAAFKIENGVTPHDNLVVVTINYEDR